ncbi:MAG: SCP2 sterol-binding domain-containing protein [Nitriliruptoraceae bacterium]|nr:SCP2 sterol-binding domain-containing protein [Nitriliruptoraceae bacterium]
MATQEQVELILEGLLVRLGDIDESTRGLLPSRRTIEARCPDLDLVRFAEWRQGRIELLDDAPPRRPDIRISIRSDDLVAMSEGELPIGRAYAEGRLRLDASMTDLLRLRAVL